MISCLQKSDKIRKKISNTKNRVRKPEFESENPSFESENPISILESERPNFESEKPMEFQVRRPQVKSIAGPSRGDMQPFYNVPFQFQSHS
jgi:hypothetical protein